jgi:hypothetical protein
LFAAIGKHGARQPLPQIRGIGHAEDMTGNKREVIFEHAKVGAIMRVTAIDAATGTEVVIQGPASASPQELQRVALTKLNYVLNKRKASGS